MNLTNFTSVVKTYQKNFIRKERFLLRRRVAQADKKRIREERIETAKAIQPLIKLRGSASKKSNFLGGIKKFLGFMLAGFTLLNLKKSSIRLLKFLKKIEIVKGITEICLLLDLERFFE